MKFKATIEVIYEVVTENYGDNKTVDEMIKIDQENFDDDPVSLLDGANADDVSISVEEYEEK